MKLPLFRLLPFGLLLAAGACSSEAERPGAASVHCRGQAAMVSLTFSVEAVDSARRAITLKGPEGNSGTYIVGPEVRRFSEIRAGDSLVVQYVVGMRAELRDPTPEETATPVKIMESVTRDPSSAPPAGALSRSVRVVTTVGDVNLERQTMTLKGPRGAMLTVKVEEVAALTGTTHGRPIIATFGEQLVLAIEPGSKNK